MLKFKDVSIETERFRASIKDEYMLKKLVVLVACCGLVIQLSGCTSKDSKGDDEIAVDSATAPADSAEVEKVEGGGNGQTPAPDIAAEDSSASLANDSLPADALGESTTPPPADNSAPMAPAAPDTAAAPPAAPDLPADALAGDSPTAPAPAAPDDKPAPVHEAKNSSPDLGGGGDAPKKEAKPVASYRKIETTPWKEGGKLLNTVYVSRKGDTWGNVSQMIYGADKASALKKMNPAIKGRQLKVGDKVYFNSTHRPDDDSKVLTYYEDSGIAPEVYIAKSGDNLKKVAKELIGSSDSWKELYATNDFESKSALDEGTQIKYWKGAGAAATVANAPPAEPPGPAAAEPSQELAANGPPPGPDANAVRPGAGAPPPPEANIPPPPPPGAPGAPGEVAAQPPPPPPPPQEMAPPPPPPPPPPVANNPPPPPPGMKAKKAEESGNPLEDDQMTTLAAGAVVAVGLALFFIMRRRRKKELEQAIQDTQVG